MTIDWSVTNQVNEVQLPFAGGVFYFLNWPLHAGGLPKMSCLCFLFGHDEHKRQILRLHHGPTGKKLATICKQKLNWKNSIWWFCLSDWRIQKHVPAVWQGWSFKSFLKIHTNHRIRQSCVALLFRMEMGLCQPKSWGEWWDQSVKMIFLPKFQHGENIFNNVLLKELSWAIT